MQHHDLTLGFMFDLALSTLSGPELYSVGS